MTVLPAKNQISLGIRPVWSESLLSVWRKLGSLATHWAHSENSDQTGRMPRLIWVFAGRTLTLLVLSWGGWNSIILLDITFWDAINNIKTHQMNIVGKSYRIHTFSMSDANLNRDKQKITLFCNSCLEENLSYITENFQSINIILVTSVRYNHLGTILSCSINMYLKNLNNSDP